MDVNILPSLKQNIRQLKKEKAEILTAGDTAKVKWIRRKIKLLKRETRELAAQKKKSAQAAVKASAEKTAAAAASE